MSLWISHTRVVGLQEGEVQTIRAVIQQQQRDADALRAAAAVAHTAELARLQQRTEEAEVHAAKLGTAMTFKERELLTATEAHKVDPRLSVRMGSVRRMLP